MNKIFLFFYNLFENYIHLHRIKVFLTKNVFLKDPIIFDIGSHKGKVVNLMNNLYKNALVYCFEPNELLNTNLKKIGENINVYNYAIGEKNEEKEIFINKIDLTNTLSQTNKNSLYLKIKNFISGKLNNTNNLKKVKVISLDNFCKINEIKKIDFLKIDVEGYEYKVLLGARDIIKNVKYVMLEVQKNDMYQDYSKENIENFLKKNNFILIKSFNFPLMFFKDCIYKKVKN
jgi:FkbM family methyltransferase